MHKSCRWLGRRLMLLALAVILTAEHQGASGSNLPASWSPTARRLLAEGSTAWLLISLLKAPLSVQNAVDRPARSMPSSLGPRCSCSIFMPASPQSVESRAIQVVQPAPVGCCLLPGVRGAQFLKICCTDKVQEVAQQSQPAAPSPVFWVLLVGDAKAGKTSLLTRLMADKFEAKHIPTEGAYSKQHPVPFRGSQAVLQVWPLACFVMHPRP